nr:hypothetical protein CFP56_25909 [Quercus suber]
MLAISHASPVNNDQRICEQKNPAAINAMSKFCQNTNIRVPSEYAAVGMPSDQDKYPFPVQVFINGKCKDEYVPVRYCLSQFQHMFVTALHTRSEPTPLTRYRCANGDKNGLGSGQYGWGDEEKPINVEILFLLEDKRYKLISTKSTWHNEDTEEQCNLQRSDAHKENAFDQASDGTDHDSHDKGCIAQPTVASTEKMQRRIRELISRECLISEIGSTEERVDGLFRMFELLKELDAE